jgi:ubiquinone/menaquinone biosynthesis C-methylase UbiE
MSSVDDGRIETMLESSRNYVPAAGHDWSLPLYDPIVKLLGADAARKTLLDRAAIRPGQRILDIGCGTGSFAVLIKRLHPDVDVVALDPDPRALARAQRKAQRASVRIQFDRGFSDALPYADASIDRVVSSFMFHHLGNDEKLATLREVRRVLVPGGSLSLLDFAGPEAGSDGLLARLFHTSHHFKDNSEQQVLALMGRAGLATPQKVEQGSMFFGQMRINYYQASVG